MKKICKYTFKEFAKITLYLCNNSDRKIYTEHLKLMIIYYLSQVNNEKTRRINYKIDKDVLKIYNFYNYLEIMKKLNFVELGKDFYGTSIIPIKNLEKNAYTNYEIEKFNIILKKSFYELKTSVN